MATSMNQKVVLPLLFVLLLQTAIVAWASPNDNLDAANDAIFLEYSSRPVPTPQSPTAPRMSVRVRIL